MAETCMKTVTTQAVCENADEMRIAPPCQEACPVGTDIPSYVGLVWDGRLEEAMETITATNPFSAICGRVCASPCEAGCKRSELDGPVTIRHLKRFVTDWLGEAYHLSPVGITRDKSVAIVGGGPAGLTAAQDLAEAGFAVSIYEQADRLGGMMNAIPPFRLPGRLIVQDIERLLAHCPGISVNLNCALGDDIPLDELKEKHDAVLLSIGLCQDRQLNIPGEDGGLEGFYGIDFLTRISRGETVPLSGRVIVVGGGNVAMDAARTAMRCGDTRVEVWCLESREEMPAWGHEVRQAEADGVKIRNGWGPKSVLSADGKVTGIVFKECVSVFDESGRFSPVYREKTIEAEADALVLAIGLQADNEQLESLDILSRGRVRASAENMGTGIPGVFAAGDCTYGPSAIVYAMRQGHRAAYYVRAWLEGEKNPASYRIPWRNRHVPVAQDPMWEKLPRQEAAFHGMEKAREMLAECESVFDPETAKQQAARCLRCDAETGTANYSRRGRSLIQAMSRSEISDTRKQADMLGELLKPRENPFPVSRPAHMDDVVFMSAALTRLVIDPYRECCATRTRITASPGIGVSDEGGRGVNLDLPYLFTGFDHAPENVKTALASAIADSGCGYIGREPLDGDVPHTWFQLLADGDVPSPGAAGLIYLMGQNFRAVSAERLNPDQLIGFSVAGPALAEAIPFALENDADLLILDATPGIELAGSELKAAPNLSVMRDAIRILREMNREEDIALISFGGMRSGTDAAKALAMNCNAVAFGAAMGIALGGSVRDAGIVFDDAANSGELADAARNWIRGTAQETAIIARCTGKTNVHNLEPEDMRTITIGTSKAMGIPLASGQEKREWF
ncbi:glutamate synthase [Desulfonema ishimotonii]|uniref:Glutamate synthase n=1 Tax=Desulfonema ishimotonii TaxID=45657 RepID=A0A401FQA8_9BACT|nr:FAD-dependent oxidoreductase [Desulfonema ishimotonii]GBC59178.1 glutamate synthase [Desulfonema ishimotonii]